MIESSRDSVLVRLLCIDSLCQFDLSMYVHVHISQLLASILDYLGRRSIKCVDIHIIAWIISVICKESCHVNSYRQGVVNELHKKQ